ncbi:sensor histidine kinase [Pseudoxanthomonas indica]|uniref:histidine kinase n=1 Tax=Pseudoxanthomonas indica TaxID=428993 RepID=A0A1T5JBS9_9GAMM|nr:sensor histidine kinase [Pseudoxanthomonas indica]GGD57756.1 two-component sensor histidine kinase [Pseudoxanthomonas indica]SKC48708.1 Signal transduction histidine kinase [Pseudoxanthomonas indica]
MRLADFIEQRRAQILDGAEEFARTQAPLGLELDAAALRNHLPQVLDAIVIDLRSRQSSVEQKAKSEGLAPKSSGPESAATSHGRTRAQGGFDVNSMVAEYRALRAAVIRLWSADAALVAASLDDMIRFNEAMDQAVAESLAEFSREVEMWRHVFLGALGHDLRGPLSVVMFTADQLALSTQGTQSAKKVSRLVSGAAHMRKLLDELLDYSKSELGIAMTLHRSPCDLATEIREEVSSLSTIIPNMAVRFTDNGPCEGHFDCVRMREAIHNLVANAAKYGDEASTILVSVTSDVEEVQVAVTNSGESIPESVLGSMFDPLRRGVKKASNGENSSLGLGLFIVREIVQAHGGEVSATSIERQTQFVITLPRS